jgi:hypothetical protein
MVASRLQAAQRRRTCRLRARREGGSARRGHGREPRNRDVATTRTRSGSGAALVNDAGILWSAISPPQRSSMSPPGWRSRSSDSGSPVSHTAVPEADQRYPSCRFVRESSHAPERVSRRSIGLGGVLPLPGMCWSAAQCNLDPQPCARLAGSRTRRPPATAATSRRTACRTSAGGNERADEMIGSCGAVRYSSVAARTRRDPRAAANTANTTSGRVTSARAIATRCCCPPDSCEGRWRRRFSSPTRAGTSRTVERFARRLSRRSGRAMFWATVGEGVRLKA